jgi:ATP-binding cassette subfamily B protein
MKTHSGLFKSYISFIASVYRNNKLFVISKVFSSLLAGALTVVTAVLPKYMADAILIDNSEYGFIMYVLFYVVAQLLVGAAYSFVELYINKALVVVNAKCTEDIMEKLYRMAYVNYERPESRNCIERAFQFATRTGVASFNTFISLISTTITLVSYVYIIARHNWITLVLLTISIIVTYVVQKQKAKYEYSLKRSLTTDERRIEYNKSTLLDRFLAKDIRYSGAFPLIKQFYHDKTNSYSKKLFKKSKKLFLYNQAVSLIQLSIVFAVMVSFGKQLFYGSMTYGDYTMSVNVSMSFTALIFQLINHVTVIYTAALESKNYNEFLELSSNDGAGSIGGDTPDIVFQNVSFKYGEDDAWVLNNFSYTFKYGKKYAIIGDNGSGKSTLLKLLLGMYAPVEGDILVGGQSISKLSPDYLYSLYSVVFQDFRLIDGITLMDNITVGKEMSNEKEIDNVLNLVGLEDKLRNDEVSAICLLKREYSRTFASDGIELSGGEKQKAVIARALIKNAPILIFDEPTSAFDNLSERKLFSAEMFDKRKTFIFVTHNVELVSVADEVIKLKCGKIESIQFKN